MTRGLRKLAGAALGAAAAMIALASAAADGIPYRRVADMLYLVMSSDRAVYTRMVVQRLTRDEKIITASEHFRDDAALPLPAQTRKWWRTRPRTFPILCCRCIRSTRRTAPGTDLEREGLEYVADNPGKTSTGKRSSAAGATSPPCIPTMPSPKPASAATTATRTRPAPMPRSVMSWAASSFVSRSTDDGRDPLPWRTPRPSVRAPSVRGPHSPVRRVRKRRGTIPRRCRAFSRSWGRRSSDRPRGSRPRPRSRSGCRRVRGGAHPVDLLRGAVDPAMMAPGPGEQRLV